MFRIDLPANHGSYLAIRDPHGEFFLVDNPTVAGGVGEIRSRIGEFRESQRFAAFAAMIDGYSQTKPGVQRRVFERLGQYTLIFGDNLETDYATVEGRCTMRFRS